MKYRPAHVSWIRAVEITPLVNESLCFHLVLTDDSGQKQVYSLDKNAVTGLLDSHINALSLIQLHAAKPRGLLA